MVSDNIYARLPKNACLSCDLKSVSVPLIYLKELQDIIIELTKRYESTPDDYLKNGYCCGATELEQLAVLRARKILNL